MDDENEKQGLEMAVREKDKGIDLENVNFKYDPHALKTIIDDVSLTIPKGKVIGHCRGFRQRKDHPHQTDVRLLFCIGRTNHHWRD